VTKIVYDTEFIDNGTTIEPLSIGMLDETGHEYYAVFDSLPTIARAVESDWLRSNVLPWLPITIDDPELVSEGLAYHVHWDAQHPEYPAVKPLDAIAEEVEDFVLAHPRPSLWAYYASYDHVLYAQLYGPMSELPDGMPQHTNDIKQEADRIGNPHLPKLSSSTVDKRFNGVRKVHHALYDAYEEYEQLVWLAAYERKPSAV
jgi:hypothetical protein